METQGWGPGGTLGQGDRRDATNEKPGRFFNGSLVCRVPPIPYAAEGGTQPSPPWIPMAPHVESFKTPCLVVNQSCLRIAEPP